MREAFPEEAFLMRSIACAAAAAIVLTGAIASAQPVATATAEIKGEGVTGTATFSEVKQGTASAVHVELSVSGLKPGMHGVQCVAVATGEYSVEQLESAGADVVFQDLSDTGRVLQSLVRL